MQQHTRTPNEAIDTALEADAKDAFGYLVRQANRELTARGWQVWYFIVFKFQGSARDCLEYARKELQRVKKWESEL